MIAAPRRVALEIVVTVVPVGDGDCGASDIEAATAAVDAGLSTRALRRAGFRVIDVEGIEPCDPIASEAAAADLGCMP